MKEKEKKEKKEKSKKEKKKIYIVWHILVYPAIYIYIYIPLKVDIGMQRMVNTGSKRTITKYTLYQPTYTDTDYWPTDLHIYR